MRRLGMQQTTNQSLKTKTSLSLERFGASEAPKYAFIIKNQDPAGNLKASGSGNHRLEHSARASHLNTAVCSSWLQIALVPSKRANYSF